jgi:hypothetical protein
MQTKKEFQSVATSECSILLEKVSLSLHKVNNKTYTNLKFKQKLDGQQAQKYSSETGGNVQPAGHIRSFLNMWIF